MPLPPRIPSTLSLFFGGLILAGAVLCTAVSFAGNGVPVTVRLTMGVVGAGLYIVGVRLFRFGKQLRAQSAWDALEHDDRPPVLYLRAFKDDPIAAEVQQMHVSALFALTASEEEQIAEVFQQLGPFVAIGRPGEVLPQLGAARLYVDDHEWQHVVSALMWKARLVLFRATDTEGFWWEIERSVKLLPPEQRLFLIPHGIDYDQFRQRAGQVLGVEFPEAPRFHRRCGSLRGLVHFRPDKTSLFITPRTSLWRNRVRKPLVPILQTMLRPVFEQQGVPWNQPPINWWVYTPYALMTVILPLVAIVLMLIKGEYAGALAMTVLIGFFQAFMASMILLGNWWANR